MAMLLDMVQGVPLIDIILDAQETRKNQRYSDKVLGEFKLPIFQGNDDISGIVEIKRNKLSKIEHLGIRLELIGRIEILNDQKMSGNFFSTQRELEPQGILFDDKSFKFSFPNFEKQNETYFGNTVRLRYMLRVTILRNYSREIMKELEIAVLLPKPDLDVTPQSSLKLEVGIEECLHIDFEYFKNKFHLRDVVTGKVNFFLVKIKIKYMELAIIRKEVVGTGSTQQTDNETLVKYEIMDGCPQKGEVIPIRLYLSGVNVTPTHRDVQGKFSVKYILNLILVDEDDRRYFKQQEITIYRKK